MRTEFPDEPAEPGFRRAVVTPHIERFKLRLLLPEAWQVAELPPEEPDFSDGTKFVPLAICIASYGAVVFTIAARPKYDDGTVMQWAAYLLSTQKVKPESVMPSRVGTFDAVEAVATQQSDAGPMRMRIFFFEDGGTLFQVGAMAPAALWDSASATFDRMLASLDFYGRTGPTVALHAEVPLKKPAESAKKPDATSKKAEQKKEKVEAPRKEPHPAPKTAAKPEAAAQPDTKPSGAKPSEPTFASVALAKDTKSLDPEQPMNKNLRNSGAGLVPNVIEVDQKARRAKIGAGSIRALFSVPFGWHVIDDGKRTLVFDAGNIIQVNFALADPEGGTLDDALDAVLAHYQSQQPAIEHLKMELGDMKCLAFRGFRDGDTVLDQAFLVRPAPGGLFLKVRVTSLPDDMSRAMDLAGLMIESMEMPE